MEPAIPKLLEGHLRLRTIVNMRTAGAAEFGRRAVIAAAALAVGEIGLVKLEIANWEVNIMNDGKPALMFLFAIMVSLSERLWFERISKALNAEVEAE